MDLSKWPGHCGMSAPRRPKGSPAPGMRPPAAKGPSSRLGCGPSRPEGIAGKDKKEDGQPKIPPPADLGREEASWPQQEVGVCREGHESRKLPVPSLPSPSHLRPNLLRNKNSMAWTSERKERTFPLLLPPASLSCPGLCKADVQKH